MPEAFLKDKSVPVKWKLYGLINGFWINGLTVYAANKFFADKLGCSERMVRSALEELEKESLLRREISGYKRTILPAGRIEEAETPLPGGGSPTSAQAETPLPPNASNNASNKNTPSSWKAEEIVMAPDPDAAPEKKPRIVPSSPTEVLNFWNALPDWRATGKRIKPNNPSAITQLLPKATMTQDIQAAIIRKRTKYTLEQFGAAFKNYASEIANRTKDSNGFYLHRWSLYEFLTHKDVFERYVNR